MPPEMGTDFNSSTQVAAARAGGGRRWCSKCGVSRDLNDFHYSVKARKFHAWCRFCLKSYYAANKDAWKARTKAWQQEHPGERSNQKRQRDGWKRAGREGKVSYRRIIERDAWVCYLCGEKILSRADLHFDHVVPLARGGTHTEANVRMAHATCNMHKGARVVAVPGQPRGHSPEQLSWL